MSEQRRQFPPEQLLMQAEEALESGNVELAGKFVQRVLETHPRDATALEMQGEVALAAGDCEAAAGAFQASIQADPTSSYAKYLNLAQLLGGADAIVLIRTAVQLMQAARAEVAANAGAYSDEAKALARQISSSLCAAAELYMSDLCFEEDAEAQATAFAEEALVADPVNPEAHLTLSSLRAVQQNIPASIEAVRVSHDMWRRSDPEDWPSYEVRLATAKQLIELELLSRAASVLDGLLLGDDTNHEAWYLRGFVHNCKAEYPEALHCLDQAAAAAAAAAHGDADAAQSWQQQLQQLAQQVQERQAAAAPPSVVPPDGDTSSEDEAGEQE